MTGANGRFIVRGGKPLVFMKFRRMILGIPESDFFELTLVSILSDGILIGAFVLFMKFRHDKRVQALSVAVGVVAFVGSIVIQEVIAAGLRSEGIAGKLSTETEIAWGLPLLTIGGMVLLYRRGQQGSKNGRSRYADRHRSSGSSRGRSHSRRHK